jgi:hypothetical protein
MGGGSENPVRVSAPLGVTVAPSRLERALGWIDSDDGFCPHSGLWVAQLTQKRDDGARRQRNPGDCRLNTGLHWGMPLSWKFQRDSASY